MKAKFSIGLSLLLIAAIAMPCSAARIHDEDFCQEWFCSMYGGQREFMFPDNTRCDCLLPFVAVEVEFADKWYEGLGQSLYYGTWARRAPGIALVIEDEEADTKYLHRLMRTIHNYGIDIRVFPIVLDSLGNPYEMWP